jgi:hypothetical protein
MWSLIKWLVMKLGVVRWLFKVLGLGFLIPIALLLKTIGWPVLLILGVLALPVLFLLFIFGLPIFLVLIVGGMVMSLLAAVLSFGLVVLKFFVFVVLPIWLAFRLFAWMFRGKRRCDDGDTGPAPESTPNPESGPEPGTGI